MKKGLLKLLSASGPIDEYGNPLILPFTDPGKRVVFLDQMLHRKARAHKRIGCYGAVVLSNDKEQIVAAGKMRDLSEKSLGFSVFEGDLNVDDVYFLEFLGHPILAFNTIKVILKRVDGASHKKIVGVEFLETTTRFRRKLDVFLDQMRNEKDGFGMNEII